MKIWISILTLCLAGSSAAYGQAVPAGVDSPSADPNIPTPDGVVHYALRGSEIAEVGFYGSGVTTYTTAFSGNVGYSSKSVTLPFSMLFAGGVLISSQSGQGTTTYQSLALSQSYITKSWVFGVSDTVSYLPETPTTGLSGIPGVGDVGSQPIEGPTQGPAGSVITTNSSRVSNGLSGVIERQITGGTSISGTGSWGILRFIDEANGLNSTQYLGQVAINHRIDARDTVSVSGVYSAYSYGQGADGLTFHTRGVNGAFQRVLTRTLSFAASVGPQWINSSDDALIPSRTTVAANIGLNYNYGPTHAGVHFVRGVNAGSGVQPGALADTIGGSLEHSLGPEWMLSFTGGYTNTEGLVQNGSGTTAPPGSETTPTIYQGGNSTTIFGSAQLSRRLSEAWSAYVSYTARQQTASSTLVGQNAFSGFSNTFAIGISFAPHATRLGEF